MDGKPLVLLQKRMTDLPDELKRLIEKEFETIYWESPERDKRKREVQALIIRDEIVDGDLLNEFPSVRVISNHGVGVDHIDLNACRSRGIRVGNTPDVVSGATADMAVALLLSCARRVCEGDEIARSPTTYSFDLNWLGCEVTGSTVGVVGMGRIGKKIASRLLGFNMKVLYNKRSRLDKDTENKLALTYYGNLLDMLPECDFVVLVVPGNEENYRMFSVEQFKAMKKSAMFVNVARGSVVNQDALVNALTKGEIAAAGIDVTDPEPLPRDHPLLHCPNITISPHVGVGTMKTRVKMVQLIVDNILCGLKGQPLVCEVV